jgi:methylated-DNA-[protein]-cysteine S-methyltransferase
MDILCTSIMTPVGTLTCFEEDGNIVVLEWGQGLQGTETPLLKEAKSQLSAYFSGKLRTFDLPLDPMGTDFQKKVWAALNDIPFGETLSYGELAEKLGSHARAIGGACGKNPIPVIIPCHRVLAKSGKMTGYSGGDGVETKEQLLRMEKGIKEHSA